MPIHTHFACASLRRWTSRACAVAVAVFATVASAFAQSADEFLCDNSFQDCRTPIINLIRQENVGLDVSFWFMTDTRYSTEIINRWRAGVPVRIILDLRADTNYPANANVRQSLINAGIPIRHKFTNGINHWKMILYAGQAKVHFSAANFANGSYSYLEGFPYTRYVDEAIYFTNDPALVQSFMSKFDDLWTDTTHHQNLANVSGPLTRNYPTYTQHSSLNFPPDQDYQDRVVSALRQETAQIDVVMFRITSAKVPDEMIRRRLAGLSVRLITDQDQYRNGTYMWHSYNVDRMYVAGIPIKWKRDEASIEEDMHQKSFVLPTRGMAIFGSSNLTSSSSDKQREHNIFSTKPWIVQWFVDQFNRKWNNLRADGTPIGTTMFQDYVPGWPETPVNVSPGNMSGGVATSIPLRWEGGWWAHKYDIYFGTTNPPPLIAQNYMPGSATAGVVSTKESFNPCTPPTGFTSACPGGLAPGTTYYWRVRGKTMVGDARAISGQVWSFTTAGGPPPPPTSDTARILADAYVRAGTSAGSNFGRATELIAKFGSDQNYLRESYMKLDISSVQPDDSVRLRLVGRLSDTRAASVVTTIYPVSSTTWTETGITWNNKPAAGTAIWASWAVSGTTNTLYEIDLTSHVQAQRAAGQTVITIVLKNNVDTLPYVTFGSRESGNAPRLLVGP